MKDKYLCKNEKILVITEFYPFFLVGEIENFNKDYIWVKAEFGVPLPLKGEVFHIKRDAISAFFVENDHQKIPTFGNEGISHD